MRICIAAVGKLKDLERDFVDRYVKRFDAAGRSLSLGPLRIVELGESRAQTAVERKNEESLRLLRTVEGCEFSIALDEGGHTMTSAAFAELLAKKRDQGVAHIGFLIGGPDGHGQPVRETARAMQSLSAMTMPHGLARIMLVEQLYRAATILAGHPYHRA